MKKLAAYLFLFISSTCAIAQADIPCRSADADNPDSVSCEDKSRVVSLPDTIRIFSLKEVEQPPSFQGGHMGLMNALSEKIRYPRSATITGKGGTVYVRFVVERDGSITNVKIIKGVSKSFDNEALRAVRSLGRMSEPAKVNGIPVRSYMDIPITFYFSPKR